MQGRPRVLIVDDDQHVRTLLELALSHGGFQVFSAPNGGSALLQLRVLRPDMVILDVMMPEPDGWETLQKIRETSSVPVMILTALDQPDLRKRCLAQGADAFLTKPIDVADLQAQTLALVTARQHQPQSIGEPLTDRDSAR